MAVTDAKHIPVKNTAFRVTFPIFDADGDLVSGATGLDSEVSIDGGTFADCTNEATEIATSSGIYYLDLTSAEMNGDTIAIIVKTSSSGAKTTPMIFYPAARNINDLAFPTTTGRSIDVTATGGVGIDWANVENPTTTLNLSGTTVKTATDVETDTADIQTSLAARLDVAVSTRLAPLVAGRTLAVSAGNLASADMIAISGDDVAADNLETMLDGTGGQTLSLGRLLVVGSNANPIFHVQNNHASGIATKFESTSGGIGLSASSVSSFGGLFSGGAGGSVRLGGSGGLDFVLHLEKVMGYLALLARKDVGLATDLTAELAEINNDWSSGAGAFVSTTDALEAIRDRGDAAWVTGTALDAAGVRAAVGLASANLDTQLGDIPTNAELATSQAAADDATLAAIAALNNLSAAQVATEIGDALTVDVIADSVATDGSRPTVAQALLMITRFLMEREVVSTTVTVNKEDGSTSSMTFTLDSATAPTTITRTS